VRLFIRRAVDDQPLPLYGGGVEGRPDQYGRDRCEGIDIALRRGEPGGIYNIGPDEQVQNIVMARKLLDLLGKPHSLIVHVFDRPGHDRRYALDCSRIKALGWRPQHTFDQALEKTVRWYVENEWWWRPIKSGEYRAYYQAWYGERLRQAAQGRSA